MNRASLRVLVLTNFYPPAHLGGMELRLGEVVHGLERRGHEVWVETSDYSPPGYEAPAQQRVYRTLPQETDLYHYRPLAHLTVRPRRLRKSVQAFERRLAAIGPDLVFIWGMWLFSPAYARVAETTMPERTVYSFAGYWPIEPDCHEQYWRGEDGGRGGRIARKVVAPVALSRLYRPVKASDLAIDKAICCSQYVLDRLRDGGLGLGEAKVVLSGIDTEMFHPAEDRSEGRKLKLICLGGFARHKGAGSIIEALGLLSAEELADIRLTIIGHGHPAYRAELEALAAELGVAEHVRMRDAVSRDEVAALLREYDGLVLATLTAEPLSRAVMEGMATGLVVMATETGGTPEMLSPGLDGLLFTAGDSHALADHIRRVKDDMALRQRLGRAARERAERSFSRDRMVDEIESYLLSVAEQHQSARV